MLYFDSHQHGRSESHGTEEFQLVTCVGPYVCVRACVEGGHVCSTFYVKVFPVFVTQSGGKTLM